MATDTTHPEPTPERTDVIPDSYAVYVTDAWVYVWQYRVNISEPDGTWYFVETLDRQNNPKLSMDHASPMPPTPDGYWIYLNQGESPAVHRGRESDTPRHKPRSTLIQGYPL